MIIQIITLNWVRTRHPNTVVMPRWEGINMTDKLWVRQSDGSYLLVDDGCQFDNCEIHDNNDGYMTSPPKEIENIKDF